jgi:hypothetical protein
MILYVTKNSLIRVEIQYANYKNLTILKCCGSVYKNDKVVSPSKIYSYSSYGTLALTNTYDRKRKNIISKTIFLTIEELHSFIGCLLFL